MKYLYNAFFFIAAMCFSLSVKSQTDITPEGLINPSFGLNGGEMYASQIATTKDGYTYSAGRFSNTIDFDLTADTFNLSSTYLYNMFIAKYDKQSHLVFAFKLSGLSGYDNITAVATDKEDNVYVAGYFANTVDFDPGPGTANLSTGNYYVYNLFFAKYDKSGNYILAKPIATNDTRIPGQINAIIVDSSSNIFIAGNGKPQDFDFDPGPDVNHPQSHGKYDAFFARYDASGNFIFSKAVGSSEDDQCWGFALNKNKNIILTGSFSSSVNDFDPDTGKVELPYKGGNDAYVGIYDSSGNYIYAFPLGGVKDDAGYGVATDNNNDIIVSGSFYGNVDFAPDSSVVKKSSDSDYDYFIARYTENAKLLFVTTIHTDSQVYTPLVIDSLGNIYIAGGFLKSVSFNPGDSLISKGGYDAFIAKYSAAGVYKFSNQISGSNDEIINELSLKNNNQLCVSGFFSDTSYFNQGNQKKITTLNRNSFIADYNTSKGNNTSANAFGTYRQFIVEAPVVKLTHDEQNNTYVTGTFQGIADFDPGIGQYLLTSSTDASTSNLFTDLTDDIFFAKYSSAGKLIFAKNLGGTEGQAPVSIAVDANHNIYLAGTFAGEMDADPGIGRVILKQRYNSSLYQSYFIGRYDSSGNYIFAEPLYISGNLKALTIDKKNNLYIAGFFAFGYFDPGNDTVKTSGIGDDIYFAKYNNNGKFIYLKNIGQKSKTQFCYDIAVNSKGNIIISGVISGSRVDFDPGPGTYYADAGSGYAHYIAAYTAAGNFLFEANAMCLNTSSTSSANILRLDKNDNILAEGPFTGSVKMDSRNDSIITSGYGISSFFLMRYNSKGIPLFVKTFSQANNFDQLTLATSLTDNNNNIYIAGEFSGKADFDPGSDTAFLRADNSMHSNNNIFLGKYDSSGNYTYAYNFAPVDSFFGRSATAPDIWLNKHSEITLAVNTNGKIDFDPGPDTFFYHPPFAVYPTAQYTYSFALVKFKQTQTFKPFLFATVIKPDIDKPRIFNVNQPGKYLK